MCSLLRRPVADRILTSALLGLLAALATLAYFWAAAPIGLTIRVRFDAATSIQERHDLERQVGLERGRLLEGNTWAYEIRSPTPVALGQIVSHPAVEDTHGFDRGSLKPPPGPPLSPAIARALVAGLGVALAVLCGLTWRQSAGVLMSSLRAVWRQLVGVLSWVEGRLTWRRCVRMLMWVFVCSQILPIKRMALEPGTDPSTYFVANYVAATDLRFGADIVFTYGPLGYLAQPQDVGANLSFAYGFQLCLWMMLSWLCWKVVSDQERSTLSAVVFVVLTSLGFVYFEASVYGVDYALAFASLLSLALATHASQWRGLFLLAVMTAIGGVFVKPATALISVAATGGWVVATTVLTPRKGVQALKLGAIAVITALLAIGARDYRSLWSYFRGSYEMMNGAATFSSQREITAYPFLLLGLVVVAGYLLLAGC